MTGNEYFDWDADRPEMVALIKKDIEKRREIKQAEAKGKVVEKEEYSEKMMGSTTRLIHDGTFPPVVSLIIGVFVQALLFLMIYLSRNHGQFTSSRAGICDTPFRGFALQIGLLSTFFSQSYVAPPVYTTMGSENSPRLYSYPLFRFYGVSWVITLLRSVRYPSMTCLTRLDPVFTRMNRSGPCLRLFTVSNKREYSSCTSVISTRTERKGRIRFASRSDRRSLHDCTSCSTDSVVSSRTSSFDN